MKKTVISAEDLWIIGKLLYKVTQSNISEADMMEAQILLNRYQLNSKQKKRVNIYVTCDFLSLWKIEFFRNKNFHFEQVLDVSLLTYSKLPAPSEILYLFITLLC